MKKTKFLQNGAFLVCAGVFMTQQVTAQSFLDPEIDPFAIENLEVEIGKMAFVDLDGDGDQDCFQANYYGNEFVYQENTGTATSPNFAEAEINPFGFNPISPSFAPVFVDIDADGDFDLFSSSEEDGTTFYYENTGTATAPSFGSEDPSPFGLTFIFAIFGNFVDIDNDGDLDAFGGIYLDDLAENKIFTCENIGTSEAPEFSEVLTDPYGITLASIDFFYFLDFADIDNDGDLDMMRSETENANIFYHENIGTATLPEFEAGEGLASPFGISNLGTDHYFWIPMLVDIDSDTDMDLFVPTTEFTGDSTFTKNYFYENRTVVAGLSDNKLTTVNFEIYPNPATTNLTLITTTPSQAVEYVRIISSDGREVFRSTQLISQIDLTNFTPGMYVIEMALTDQSIQQIKFVKN